MVTFLKVTMVTLGGFCITINSNFIRLVSILVRYTVDIGYKNTFYKNIPVIRTIFWETVLSISVEKVSVIRTYFSTPNDVLITGILAKSSEMSSFLG